MLAQAKISAYLPSFHNEIEEWQDLMIPETDTNQIEFIIQEIIELGLELKIGFRGDIEEARYIYLLARDDPNGRYQHWTSMLVLDIESI